MSDACVLMLQTVSIVSNVVIHVQYTLTFKKVAKPPSDHGGIPSIRFAVHIRLQCIRSISARPTAAGGVTFSFEVVV
jgi:hypothetical protein